MTDDHSAARESPFEIINRYVQNRGQTERILFALTDAGWQITRRDPAAGRVTIPIEHARAIVDHTFSWRSAEESLVLSDAVAYLESQLTEATTG